VGLWEVINKTELKKESACHHHLSISCFLSMECAGICKSCKFCSMELKDVDVKACGANLHVKRGNLGEMEMEITY